MRATHWGVGGVNMRVCAGTVRDRRSQKAGVRRALRKRGLTLELVFHPEALTFDNDRVGMMQQPIQDCGGQGAVMIEDRGPLLEGAVRGEDHRPLFIAKADHLEEQISARLVYREIAELVEDKQRRFGVFFEFRFETARALRRGQRVHDINGTGKEHRAALEAGGIAQRRRQMSFTVLMTVPSWG